tara:strand:+ start:80 stop:295 length:216 start_codon:yes stop_codon:yes gene_type:complete
MARLKNPKLEVPLSEEVRKEILRRCEILKYMGDCAIFNYWEETDEELIENYSWVLDPQHDHFLADDFEITI